MKGIEALGVILVPVLLYMLNNIRAEVRENRKDIKYILQHLKDRCDHCD